jgi:3-hydroxybutyryl-CoA dehydrogenase
MLWVIGGGTMGRGIAEVFARAGWEVYVREVESAALDRLRALQEKYPNLRAGGEWPKTSPPAYVLEAVPENLALKKGVFSELASRIGPETIVATNTSALSVHELARELPYRERFLGWHFFNPATRLPLVEVIPTVFTASQVVERSLAILKEVGKEPIVAPDVPGFIVNRVARPYYVEALRWAERGVPVETIDRLMEGIGFRMGPFRLMDLIGVEVNHAVTQAVWEGLYRPSRFRPSWLQAQKVAAGLLGRKTGRGFYEYPAE